MRLFAVAIAISIVSVPLLGGYAARDAWIAVAGHATGAGGRHFETTVYMTDTSRSMNDVTVSFFPAGEPAATQRSMTLQLGPNQTGTIDIGPQLAGDRSAVGALHIRSSGLLLTQAHLYSHLENQPLSSEVGEVLNAIPTSFAIGAGDSTLLHVPAGAHYKLYAVETNGFPLYFSVASGGTERRLLIRTHEQRSWDLAAILPGAQVSTLNITGINGSGKIIVLGTAIAEQSQDFTAYEMLLPTRARHRMTWPEMTVYTAVALAIALAAIYRLKKPAQA